LNKKKIFLNGLYYILGRAISYTGLGVILYFGASKFHIASFFNTYGEKILGPLMILIGFYMLKLRQLFKQSNSCCHQQWIIKNKRRKNTAYKLSK
jgi:sulfite exporter TauE/SafE